MPKLVIKRASRLEVHVGREINSALLRDYLCLLSRKRQWTRTFPCPICKTLWHLGMQLRSGNGNHSHLTAANGLICTGNPALFSTRRSQVSSEACTVAGTVSEAQQELLWFNTHACPLWFLQESWPCCRIHGAYYQKELCVEYGLLEMVTFLPYWPGYFLLPSSCILKRKNMKNSEFSL